jgi:hypothetical protein
MASYNKHKASIRLGHGYGGDGTNPGDIFMSAKFDFMLITDVEEDPEAHREVLMRIIDELHKVLQGEACGKDFWKQNQHSWPLPSISPFEEEIPAAQQPQK